MKRILTFMLFIAAIAVNSVMGATGAAVLEVSPVAGAIAVNSIAFVSSAFGGFLPAGALGAGVFTEVWTGEMNKAFKLTEEMVGWYKRIRSYDDKVENDVIHFVNIGGKPEVLVNNNSYPIGISTIADADKAITLNKFQTKRTIVTDDALHGISYDKMASDIDLHKEAIEESKFARAIHAIAPTRNATGAPVIATSGNAVDGRKALTKADLIKLKKAFDKLKVPASDRILVLCPDHVNDLLAFDQNFEKQYYNYENGKIGRTLGFEVYEYTDCPYYNVTSKDKMTFVALPIEGTHTMASVAFAASKCMRADGSLKMYYKDAQTNPETQASEVNFRKYSICLPLGEDCVGAIYSDKA